MQVGLLLIGALTAAALAFLSVPQAMDSVAMLAARDDPATLAEIQIARVLDESAAAKEIEAALAAGDPDLAQSFLDLAGYHGVPVAPALAGRVAAAIADENSPAHRAQQFAKGFVIGEPKDLAEIAGTVAGDLFVFGDLRDAVREGGRLAAGREADYLILGLAGVGLAATAGTYATLGGAAPARVGLTLAKAARRTGRLGPELTNWLGRAVRNVKSDRGRPILDLARQVGQVQGKAGTRAAIDALKIVHGPRDMARIARLAEKKGSKTRAALKLLGRGAIVLTAGTWSLVSWIVWAVLALLSFAASLKRAAERMTTRHLQRRKRRLLRRYEREMRNACGRAVMPAHAAAR